MADFVGCMSLAPSRAPAHPIEGDTIETSSAMPSLCPDGFRDKLEGE
jgi:hypothetical protein